MRSESCLSDPKRISPLTVESKPPSTPPPRLNGSLHQRTNSQLGTPPSFLPLPRPSGLLQTRDGEHPISPTALPRGPRKGTMVRQMAFSYGSPEIIRTQKPSNSQSSLGSPKPATKKSPPSKPTLNVDKELSVLFDDLTSSWLPISTAPPTSEDDCFSEKQEHITRSPKDEFGEPVTQDSPTRATGLGLNINCMRQEGDSLEDQDIVMQ